MIITIQHKEEIEVNEVVIETALVKALSIYYRISALNGEVGDGVERGLCSGSAER